MARESAWLKIFLSPVFDKEKVERARKTAAHYSSWKSYSVVIRKALQHVYPGDLFDKKSENLLKTFIGFIFPWHKVDASVSRKLLSFSVIFPLLLGIKNIVTFMTEGLPKILEAMTALQVSRSVSGWKGLEGSNNGGKTIPNAAGIVLGSFSFMLFRLLRTMGSALTSPVQAMKDGIKAGNKLGGAKGKVLGGLLASLSAAVTVAFYTFAFPLAVKALVVNSPSLVTSLSALSPRIASAISWFSSASFSLVNPISLGLGASAAVVSVGSALSYRGIVSRWNARRERVKNRAAVITTDVGGVENHEANAVAGDGDEAGAVTPTKSLSRSSSGELHTKKPAPSPAAKQVGSQVDAAENELSKIQFQVNQKIRSLLEFIDKVVGSHGFKSASRSFNQEQSNGLLDFNEYKHGISDKELDEGDLRQIDRYVGSLYPSLGSKLRDVENEIRSIRAGA